MLQTRRGRTRPSDNQMEKVIWASAYANAAGSASARARAADRTVRTLSALEQRREGDIGPEYDVARSNVMLELPEVDAWYRIQTASLARIVSSSAYQGSVCRSLRALPERIARFLRIPSDCPDLLPLAGSAPLRHWHRYLACSRSGKHTRTPNFNEVIVMPCTGLGILFLERGLFVAYMANAYERADIKLIFLRFCSIKTDATPARWGPSAVIGVQTLPAISILLTLENQS